MATPFLGQISLVSFSFPPRGWAFCWGQTLAIQQNAALFSLLGTQYGGDGRITFQLPNLQGRVALSTGDSNGQYVIGQQGGEESHTLVYAEMPIHNHLFGSVNQASTAIPSGNTFAAMPRRGVARYAPAGSGIQINDGSGASAGGSQPHENRQPYLALNYIIALAGIFPSQN
jgi:microcystin-dependent protein